MTKQNGIRNILSQHKVVPVVTFSNLSQIDDVVHHLMSNKIKCIEITLRNEISRKAVSIVKGKFADQIAIGVGTVVNKDDIDFCENNQVDFIVSPGSSTYLLKCLDSTSIPFLPGVSSVNDIMNAMEFGLDTLKFFPAELSGGLKMLKQFNALFSQIKFCPTGGINELNYQDYLAMENVLSVGGSWIVEYKR